MQSVKTFDPSKLFNQDTTMTQNNSNRLLKSVEVDMPLVQRMLNLLHITPLGDISVPENGRIASNVCINTRELGYVMLRFYPEGCQEEKTETGNVDFEIEALHYLSSNNIPVPTPLSFGLDRYKWEENGIKVFAYSLLPGKALKVTDLSNEIATQCSNLLKSMIKVSEHYHPSKEAPEGDLEYFLKIHQILVGRNSQLKSSPELKEMVEFTGKVIQKGEVSKTPRGIVHADFFFENILKESNGKLSAIDFGDAYYGLLVMDIVIGSMEFCVLEDMSWDLDMFKSFLVPHSEWLKKNKISSEMFHDLLAANCLRFAVYTMPNTLEANESVSENPYVIRFFKLMTPELESNIKSIYDQIIQ